MANATNTSGGPPPRWIMKLVTKLHAGLSKLSGGRWFNSIGGDAVCFVGTVGRKSGRKRTIPLMYVPSDDRVLLVASLGGAPKHPVWFHNIVAHPEITIRYHRKTSAFHARLATSDEKVALWPICDSYYAPFAKYRERTTRDIPIFICTPT